MKKGIFLVLTTVVIGILLLAGCAAPESPAVSQEPELRGEIEGMKGRLNTAEQEISGIKKTLNDELPKIHDGISSLADQMETVANSLEKLDEQKAIGMLSTQMAAVQQDITDLKEGKDETTQSQCSSPRHRSFCQTTCRSFRQFSSSIDIEKKGSISVDESGYYEIRISPSDAEITIDGREVISCEIIYLNYGKRTVRSSEPISVSYRLVYY
jgi:TolA-binding protein